MLLLWLGQCVLICHFHYTIKDTCYKLHKFNRYDTLIERDANYKWHISTVDSFTQLYSYGHYNRMARWQFYMLYNV